MQIKFRMFKLYWTDHFEDTLTSINFPNNQKCNSTTKIYDIIIPKFMVVIDKKKGKK